MSQSSLKQVCCNLYSSLFNRPGSYTQVSLGLVDMWPSSVATAVPKSALNNKINFSSKSLEQSHYTISNTQILKNASFKVTGHPPAHLSPV